MAFTVSYKYTIIDKYSRPLGKIAKLTDKFVAKTRKAQKVTKDFSNKMLSMQNTFASIGGVMAVAFPSRAAMEFEDVMTDVLKVVNFATQDQFVAFKNEIFKTSLALGKLPKDIAEIAVQGGKLGVLPENLSDFIGIVARTSVAFDMLEGTAAEQIGSIKSKLGLTIDETGKLMDAVNFLADNTAAGGEKMIEVIARTAGNLKVLKMPTKFMAGWAAFADQIEVTPQLAASGLNMMINRMAKMPGMLEKMVESPNEAIKGLLVRLSKLDAVRQQRTVQQLFGPEAARFVLKAVGNVKLLDKTLGFVGEKADFAGSMMRELEKKLKTGKTSWDRIKATLNIVAITIGDAMLPAIKALAPIVVKAALYFRDFAKAHPGMMKILAVVLGLVAVGGPLIIFLGLVASSISSLIGLFSALGIAINVAIWPVTLIAAAIALLIAQIALVWIYWDDLVKLIKKYPILLIAVGPIMLLVKGLKMLVFAVKYLWKNWEEIWAGIKQTMVDVWEASPLAKIIQGIQYARSLFKRDGQEGVAARGNRAMQGSLNGQINITAQGAKVDSAQIESNVPGDLGFNMMDPMEAPIG